MTGLPDVDGFKICIQVCVWLGFPPPVITASNDSSIELRKTILLKSRVPRSPSLSQQNAIVNVQYILSSL